MPVLEKTAGPYAVGVATFVLPIRPTCVIGGTVVRTETGQTAPALRLEEVSFTAYYPVSPTVAKLRWNWLEWFPRYLLALVISYLYFTSLTMIYPGAPVGRWWIPFEVMLTSRVRWHLTFVRLF